MIGLCHEYVMCSLKWNWIFVLSLFTRTSCIRGSASEEYKLCNIRVFSPPRIIFTFVFRYSERQCETQYVSPTVMSSLRNISCFHSASLVECFLFPTILQTLWCQCTTAEWKDWYCVARAEQRGCWGQLQIEQRLALPFPGTEWWGANIWNVEGDALPFDNMSLFLLFGLYFILLVIFYVPLILLFVPVYLLSFLLLLSINPPLRLLLFLFHLIQGFLIFFLILILTPLLHLLRVIYSFLVHQILIFLPFDIPASFHI